MKYFTKLFWVLLWALTLTIQPSSAQFSLLGVGYGGSVVSINPVTGQGVAIGYAGFRVLFNSLAENSAGTLYSASGNQLIQINPNTGQGTSMATLSIGDIRGLAFSGADLLYAIQDGGGTEYPDNLYTINLASGTATLVGNTGMNGIQGLDFSPQGILYGWESGSGSGIGNGLVTINPQTGIATDVNPALDGTAQIQSIVFGPDGNLYGGRDALYRIDVTTGAATLIGSGGYSDLRGLEVVPEPSTVILGTLGALSFFLFWHRRGSN